MREMASGKRKDDEKSLHDMAMELVCEGELKTEGRRGRRKLMISVQFRDVVRASEGGLRRHWWGGHRVVADSMWLVRVVARPKEARKSSASKKG